MWITYWDLLFKDEIRAEVFDAAFSFSLVKTGRKITLRASVREAFSYGANYYSDKPFRKELEECVVHFMDSAMSTGKSLNIEKVLELWEQY